MNLNKPPNNIKKSPDNIRSVIDDSRNIVILGIPFELKDKVREWWEEVQERLRHDPQYLPIKSIPKEELEIELD